MSVGRPRIPSVSQIERRTVGPFFNDHFVRAIHDDFVGIKVDASRMTLSYISLHTAKEVCPLPPYLVAALIDHIRLAGKLWQARSGYSIRTGELKISLDDKPTILVFASATLEDKAVFRLLRPGEPRNAPDVRSFFTPSDVVSALLSQADRHLMSEQMQSAVVLLGIALENTLAFASKSSGREVPRAGLAVALNMARSLNLLEPHEYAVADKVRTFRNTAAHTLLDNERYEECVTMRQLVHVLAQRFHLVG